MSFTLYNYVLSGNCYKIRLMAGLLDVAHENVAVDFHPGAEHKASHMLALNPAGTLPVLASGDMVLSQTPAMLTWLAASFDASGKWWPRTEPRAAAQVQEWLAFSAELTATVGEARLHAMLGREIDVEAAHRGARKALRQLEAYLNERVFDGGVWLVGENPTIADIACFPYVALSPDAGIEQDPYPAVRNWLYAVRSLPGFVTMPGIHALHEQRETLPEHG